MEIYKVDSWRERFLLLPGNGTASTLFVLVVATAATASSSAAAFVVVDFVAAVVVSGVGIVAAALVV
jgi:hypothetical protein